MEKWHDSEIWKLASSISKILIDVTKLIQYLGFVKKY